MTQAKITHTNIACTVSRMAKRAKVHATHVKEGRDAATYAELVRLEMETAIDQMRRLISKISPTIY